MQGIIIGNISNTYKIKTENQIYEIRRFVESWLANKDTNRWKNDAIISFLRGV